MSKWSRQPTTRLVPDAERQARIREIRGARRGNRWSRPLGCVCLLLAMWFVLCPSYPAPCAFTTQFSAESLEELVPQAIAPRGAIGDSGWHFTFVLPIGATNAELVLLDEALDEVHREPAFAGMFNATDAVRAYLRDGRQYHWRVEAQCRGELRQSASIALCFSGPKSAVDIVTISFGPDEAQLRK